MANENSQSIRFIMLGGFLGAGKTTTIARLAKHYREQGLNVGIVTNDQAEDLVDTQTLRSQGFDVGEVAGACFCCNFNELTSTVEALSENQKPDVVIAEPVGSCTDLVATVVQPLMRLFVGTFDVAPYGVILKPSHGRRILSDQQAAGFSPKAAYIFEKQLEEADFIIINRVDELSPAEVDQLSSLIQNKVPEIPVIKMSAKTGEGFAALIENLEQQGTFGTRILDLDYDIYAEGEAELGWLNSSYSLESEDKFNLDDLLMDILNRLSETLNEAEAEIAHLKTIGLYEGFYGVANIVSSDTPATLSLPSNCEVKAANLVVNARVAVDPTLLHEHVKIALSDACSKLNIKVLTEQSQHFRPGRPVPTHRFAKDD